MKIKLIFFSLVVSFLSISFAQDITGNIEGMVSDSLGNPLPSVNISVQSENLQGQRGTATNEKGYFTIFYLPVGTYKVKISMVGFRELVIENVQIRLGKTTYLGNLKLSPEAINLPEVTVSGERNIIDPTHTNYGGNLQAKDFDQLPISRDYQSIITLLPQANTSGFGDGVNIGGSTGFENKYFVDGVEVTNPVLGTSALNLPYNFINEVEVKSGGYEAEYRSALGGLVNVITHSGSNEFHGTAFGFFTNNRFSRDSKLGLLDPSQGNFSNYDFGIGLGGPVIYDKLWFYAAYNPTVNNRDVEVPGFGIYNDKTLIHSFAAKLSWSATQNLRLFLTATGDPTKWNSVGPDGWTPPTILLNPDPYFYDLTGGGANISLNGIYTLDENLIFNALISRLKRFSIKEPSTEVGKEEIFFWDRRTNTWSGGAEEYWDVTGYSTTYGLNATFSANNHLLKAGVEYKVKETDFLFENSHVRQGNDTTFGYFTSKYFGEVYHHVPSAYIQDSWQITNNLRVNGGIRWDGQYFFGSNGQNVQTITMPLQPRIGIIFLPDKEGLQKIFASYGRFCQEVALMLSVNYHSEEGYDYIIRYDHDPRISQSGGDTISAFLPSIETEVEGLRGQYFDEFSLGYERLIGWNIKVGVQGLYRTLREAVEDVWLIDEGRYQYGNPGRGMLSDWPKPQRDYLALIISFQRTNDKYLNFLASYVLSRDYGNYEGLFDSFNHGGVPNINWTFDDLNTARVNATGLVPNDRTHVFKFSGSYSFSFGFSAGLSFIIQTGTPLSELASTELSSVNGMKFITPRGSSGRTPTIWDLSARFTYELPVMNLIRSRFILDLFHIASQREPVDIDQLHYFDVDANGNPYNPNPTYGQAYRYQQPMSMRLGMEINF